MRMKTTVFLGGGNITSALAAGLRLAEYSGGIVVYDRHPEKLRALRRQSRIEVARDLKSAVERADMLIVAVRPGSVKEMLRSLQRAASRRRDCASAWLREFRCGICGSGCLRCDGRGRCRARCAASEKD